MDLPALREQFDRLGVIEPQTHLGYWPQKVVGQWRHSWDAACRWRTALRGGCLWSRDNGPAYFDYDRVTFSQQVRWADRGWDIRADARLGWYFSKVQRVGSDLCARAYAWAELRTERRLGQRWLLYAAAERGWNHSKDPLDDYRDRAVNGGVDVGF